MEVVQSGRGFAVDGGDWTEVPFFPRSDLSPIVEVSERLGAAVQGRRQEVALAGALPEQPGDGELGRVVPDEVVGEAGSEAPVP